MQQVGLTYRVCLWIVLCGAWLWAPEAHAQISLEASVDRTRVEVGELIQLTVRVSSESMSGLPAPDLTEPNGLQLAGSTSSSSTSISIVNGSMQTTRATTYVYSFRARREGSYVLGPVTLTHDGKTYSSSAIRVEVVKASGQPRTRPAPAPGQTMDPAAVQEIEQNLFLQAIPDKKTVYVGEQVSVTYKLYTRYNLQNVHYGQVPTFTGFWAETLFDAQRLGLQREVVDGRTFNTALLKRLVLFPTTVGTQQLEQLEVVCDIPAPRRSRSLFDFDPFDSFDPFRTQQVTVRSGDVSLDVKPLPGGAPAGFHGAVGRFDLRVEASPTKVKVGDPITVRVTLSGTGNLHAISELDHPENDGLKFYEPKASLETKPQGNRLAGTKTFEYVVIPETSGRNILLPFRLVFFDPDTEKYDVLETHSVALTVEKNTSVDAAPLVGLNREEVRVLGEDIRYIKPDHSHLSSQGGLLYERGWFWTLQVLPFLGVGIAYGYRRHRDRILGDQAYARRRRSRGEARRRLVEANRLLKAGEHAAFHGELHRTLTQFLADRLDRAAGGMTSDEAVGILAERGMDSETVQQIQTVLETCDAARFAPGAVSDDRMRALYSQAEGLIDELGRKI